MMIYRAFGAGMLICLILIACPAFAQVKTDGSLGPATSLSGNMVIGNALGKQVGANLFHSFSLFNINTGESATFTSSFSGATKNVIARVTGNNSSWIDGTLGSDIPGADLWLINPKGIAFGKNASLDVKGSFRASTADYLVFQDGKRFDAKLPSGPELLSVADPSAFGFLSSLPAPISINESILEVPNGRSLGFVGGDIGIVGGPEGYLSAPGGRIDLVSVASAGEARLVPGNALDVASFAALGSVSLSDQSLLDVSGYYGYGGSVYIRGGRFYLDNSKIETEVVDYGSGPIDIATTGEIDIAGSILRTTTWGSGKSGDIRISAGGDLVLSNNSGISTNSWSDGGCGDITLSGQNISLSKGAFISTDGWTEKTKGQIGSISLSAPGAISISGRIDSSSSSPIRAGTISLDSASLVIDGGAASSVGEKSGLSGDVSVKAVDIYLRDGTLAVNSWGSGSGGTLTIRASEKLEITESSYLTSSASKSGPGGQIHIIAPKVLIQDSTVESGSFGSGKGGDIVIECSHLSLLSGQINSGASSTGDGGTISIQADSDVLLKTLENSLYVRISTDTTNFQSKFDGEDGNGGAIFISSPVLTLDNGIVSSMATKGTGNAGSIKINVNELIVTNGGYIDAMTSSGSMGQGGAISINARDSILIAGESPGSAWKQFSHISAATGGTGNAGDIDINTGSLKVTDNGIIDVSSLGSGSAGAIRIHANEITVARSSSGISGIVSKAYDKGKGGDILITADRLHLIAGEINASTSGEGNAGGISLQLGNLTISDEGNIQAESDGAGSAGTIRITADTILISSSGRDKSSSGILNGASEDGSGGDIWVTANDMELVSDDISGNVPSVILANSSGSGNAGSITLDFKESLLLKNSGIFTDAESSAGGNINLNVGSMLQMQGSEIKSSANGITPTDNGGNLTISKPQFMVLNTSSVLANANAGNGGNINLGAAYFVNSSDSSISASSKKGLAGTIVIDSPNRVTGTIAVLPVPSLNVSELLRERCAAAANRGRSSFTIQGPGGIAPRPGDYLASPFPHLKKSEADMISRSVR